MTWGVEKIEVEIRGHQRFQFIMCYRPKLGLLLLNEEEIEAP